MRILRSAPEIIMWLLIAGVALINVAIYTGVVRGEDAVDLRQPRATGEPFLSTTPEAAPTLSPDRQQAHDAELDDSPDLPGRFVPTQGRQHTDPYPLDERIPFCPENQISNDCYASNPPTSGLHLPVQGTVRLADGNSVKIPPDPGIYDFEIPREAIPHLQEHAGVFVGYHCVTNACEQAVEELENLVSQKLSLGARVVLAPSPDLAEDTIGMAAWTRVDVLSIGEFTEDRVSRFIDAHSCRFDPEGFCPEGSRTRAPPVRSSLADGWSR
jgi:hypothetical protein